MRPINRSPYMPPQKGTIDKVVVEIDSSSDDEAEICARTSNFNGYSSASSRPTAVNGINASHEGAGAVSSTYQTAEFKSFWKAGNCDVGPVAKFNSSPDLLEHARVHPKFLHSNATSHKWAFGAIAELVDNTVDEVQNGATFVKVDKINIREDNSPALLFQDDGGGMDPQGIWKCVSLDYSSKKTNTTIGQSKQHKVLDFSLTLFLEKLGRMMSLFQCSEKDWSSNLNTILEWSPFESKEGLMEQFEDIGSHGTKIIISNLWLNDEGIYELSFDDDDEDIRLRDEATLASTTKVHKRVAEIRSHISYSLRYSLRAYASILYLRKFTNFKILLRGKPVEQYSIADDLMYSKVVSYKPQSAAAPKEVAVETTVGFIKEASTLGVSGFNVYHKNILIRPYWKVTSNGTSKGCGVAGKGKTQKQHKASHFPLGAQQSTQTRPPVVNGLSASARQLSSCGFSSQEDPMSCYKTSASADGTQCMSVELIREENIKLSMRCEAHKRADAELKEKIRKVEKELAEMQEKCAQLSSCLETKRKQNAVKIQFVELE